MTEWEGARVGAYQLGRRLGSGPGGAAYLATSQDRGNSVALRLLPAPRSSVDGGGTAAPNDASMQRFRREAERLRQFYAPGILPLLAYGAEGNICYLASPYVAAGTLSDAIRTGQLSDPRQPLPLAPAVVATIVRQVAAALQMAHDQGIVHERVRTRNIFITWHAGANRPNSSAEQPWTLLLADCGHTGLLRAIGADSFDASAALYSAPEQRAGLPVPASDQYALACMAFQLLTGQAVFSGTVEELERQHRAVSPPLASRANPRLPRAADALFPRALAKAPDQRYPSIRDFALAFDTVFGQETMRPAGQPARQQAPAGESDVQETLKSPPPRAAAIQRIPDGTPAPLPAHLRASAPPHSHSHAHPRVALSRRAGLALLALIVVLASVGGLALALAHRTSVPGAPGAQVVRVGAPALLTAQPADIVSGGTVIFGALPALPPGHPPAQATEPQLTGRTASQDAAVYAAASHIYHLLASQASLPGVPGNATPAKQISGLGQRDVGIASPVDVSVGVGGGYVVEAVDGALAVYSASGEGAGGPFALADVFALVLRTGDTLGEPRILFDSGSQRWLLVASEQESMQGGVVTGDFDIAISAGTNPLNGWTIFRLNTQLHGAMGCSWADDPRIGADAAAYYLTGSEFHCGTDTYLTGAALWRLPKQTFAGGQLGPATVWTGFTAVRGKPALSLAPAVESGGDYVEWLVSNDAGYADNGTLSQRLALWAFVDSGAKGAPPTVLTTVVPLQTPYADPPLAAQGGSTQLVATGDARVSSAVLAGGHLYTAFTTAVNWSGDSATRAGVYWLDIVPEAVSPGVAGGQDSATAPIKANVFGFAGGYTFYPQIVADTSGDVLLVVTASAGSLAPSVLYASYHTEGGRATLDRAGLLAKGDQPARSHWGDYMGAAVAQTQSSGASLAVWVAGAVDAGAAGTWRTDIWQVDIGEK